MINGEERNRSEFSPAFFQEGMITIIKNNNNKKKEWRTLCGTKEKRDVFNLCPDVSIIMTCIFKIVVKFTDEGKNIYTYTYIYIVIIGLK